MLLRQAIDRHLCVHRRLSLGEQCKLLQLAMNIFSFSRHETINSNSKKTVNLLTFWGPTPSFRLLLALCEHKHHRFDGNLILEHRQPYDFHPFSNEFESQFYVYGVWSMTIWQRMETWELIGVCKHFYAFWKLMNSTATRRRLSTTTARQGIYVMFGLSTSNLILKFYYSMNFALFIQASLNFERKMKWKGTNEENPKIVFDVAP